MVDKYCLLGGFDLEFIFWSSVRGLLSDYFLNDYFMDLMRYKLDGNKEVLGSGYFLWFILVDRVLILWLFWYFLFVGGFLFGKMVKRF